MLKVSDRGRSLIFQDDGALVAVRGRCSRLGPQVARCPIPLGDAPRLRLGDRDDRVVIASRRNSPFNGAYAKGGLGDDVIRGGAGFEFMNGGGGRDIVEGRGSADDLHAGPGRDKLFGGAGSDYLSDDRVRAPTSRDLFDGGGGYDTLSYGARMDSMRIDFSRRPVMQRPERDRVRGVEAVATGRGDDRVSGDGSKDVFNSNGGHDRIFGRGGKDVLSAASGQDLVNGGAGEDLIEAHGPSSTLIGGPGDDSLVTFDAFFKAFPRLRRPSEVRCGPGYDDVTTAPFDLLTACEQASGWREASLAVRIQPEIAGDVATYSGRCESFRPCVGQLTMKTADGTNLGAADFDLPDNGEFRTFTLSLTEAGREAIRNSKRVRVDIDSSRGPRSFGYTTKLQP